MHLDNDGPNSVFCGRCAHPLPDETQSFCSTCGAAFSIYPPTTDFVLIVEHQLEVSHRRIRRKQTLIVGAWASLCIALFFTAATIFRETKIQRMSSDREVEFYISNFDAYPSVPEYITRDAILVALQSFEDHFGFKIKRWRVISDQIPEDVQGFMSSVPTDKLEDLSVWRNLYRQKLMPQWRQSPYAPLRVLITNIPIKAGDFLKMETRHLSSSRLIGGFANPAFVIISSYRMLTELHESDPAQQSRYLGEFLMAHEMGHALLGLPDFVAPPQTQEFSARGIASQSDVTFSHCLMHTDEGGGLAAWKALRERPMRTDAQCYSYQDLVRAHELRKEALDLAHQKNFELAIKKMDLALTLLPADRSLPWLRELWTDERQELSRF